MIIRLGEALDKKKLSMARFARILNIEAKQMSRTIRTPNPRMKEIILWMKVLEVTFDEFVEDDGKEEIRITKPTSSKATPKKSALLAEEEVEAMRKEARKMKTKIGIRNKGIRDRK